MPTVRSPSVFFIRLTARAAGRVLPALVVALLLLVGDVTMTWASAYNQDTGAGMETGQETGTKAPVTAPAPAACQSPGSWWRSGGAHDVAESDLAEVFAGLANTRVLLLGEAHDDPRHHLWQEMVLRHLLARGQPFALGLEMVPRTYQAALDRWSAGLSDEAALLAESAWDRVWHFDFALYRPIFALVRAHAIPLRALNVPPELIRRVARDGWASIPVDERAGVGEPEAPRPEYRTLLQEVYVLHGRAAATTDSLAVAPVATLSAEENALTRFVAAQLLWDRGMAEAIAGLHAATGRLVVALVGAGHVENRLGIPHQLAALGFTHGDVQVWLPWNPEAACQRLAPEYADVLFTVAMPGAP